jgi:hypothetical protein
VELAKSFKNSWEGYERRRMARRTEDLMKCILCDVYFSWESSSPICSACSHKAITQYQPTGKIVNTFV